MNAPDPYRNDPEYVADVASFYQPTIPTKAFFAGAATFTPLYPFFGILAMFPAMLVWFVAVAVLSYRAKRAAR